MKLSPKGMQLALDSLRMASDAQFLCLVKDSRRCVDCGATYEKCSCPTTESERISRLPVSVGDVR